MKCIILAGGCGDGLWPLSRKNLPKQFIQIRGDHSLFQETIARNIPYCDEFIIATHENYRHLVNNQIDVFQGLVHRFIFEGEARKTTASITLACMELPLSEVVLVVPADQIIYGEVYKDELLKASALCEEGKVVTFGNNPGGKNERYAYINVDGSTKHYFAPGTIDREQLDNAEENLYVSSGIYMFRVGDYLRELKEHSMQIYDACKVALSMKNTIGNEIYLGQQIMHSLPAMMVEDVILSKFDNAFVLPAEFGLKDIGSLEDLKQTELKTAPHGQQICYKCENTDIINQCQRRVVVASGLEDAIIVNTKDVVYVGKKEYSDQVKDIIEQNKQISEFVEGCRILYKEWGSYEILVDTAGFRVKKYTVSAGKSIFSHRHAQRNDHLTILSGEALIEIDGNSITVKCDDVVDINAGLLHQITNVGIGELIFVESSIGEGLIEEDDDSSRERILTDEKLGKNVEPFVKLRPVFKDWLWGGNTLKERFGKKCDFDIVAESWELSAHDAGASIVDSGRHKGMNFAEYLDVIGRKNWGWKCRPLNAFPILIKFIDAHDSLSVQVHPNDDYALAFENQYGKNEMWYILDCEPGAFIYCGFNRDIDREEVRQRVADNTILEVLNKIPVHKGASYFIPAGTVHAIGAGILICEIQQSSNCTYRLYDFDRQDKFGNRRELHLEKALDVLKYEKYESEAEAFEEEKHDCYSLKVLTRCKYFESTRYILDGEMEYRGGEESFNSFVCVSGSGTLSLLNDSENSISFNAGDSIFMPKNTAVILIKGSCEFIVTKI